MNERELKCIGQRIATNIASQEDTRALYREVRILREVLRDVSNSVADAHALVLVRDALGSED